MVGRGRRRDEEGQDEEAEVWAALERLPTYDRMRTTILSKEAEARKSRRAVQLQEVDLDQYLMQQIFKLNNPEEDNEKFLARLRKRIDE